MTDQTRNRRRAGRNLVRIKTEGNTHMVVYVQRSKGQTALAAQFYAPDTTMEEVREWCQLCGYVIEGEVI